MSQSDSQRAYSSSSLVNPDAWQAVCSQEDLVSNSGVVVWLDGAQSGAVLPAGCRRQDPLCHR